MVVRERDMEMSEQDVLRYLSALRTLRLSIGQFHHVSSIQL